MRDSGVRGHGGFRTHDLRVKNPSLFQLSYTPFIIIYRDPNGRIRTVVFRSSAGRSSQLSYIGRCSDAGVGADESTLSTLHGTWLLSGIGRATTESSGARPGHVRQPGGVPVLGAGFEPALCRIMRPMPRRSAIPASCDLGSPRTRTGHLRLVIATLFQMS